jgi:arylformamidase
MAKTYYDLTLDLTPDVIIYPGEPHPEFRELKSMQSGDPYNLTSITLTTHTGTHIDAPKHLIDNGITVDQLEFDRLLGPAQVIEILGADSITEVDLRNKEVRLNEIVLLKTDNSGRVAGSSFDPAFTYLTAGAAQYLVDCRIKTLGFDYFSVEKYPVTEPEVHNLLLGNGIPIIEGLNLHDVPPGQYQIAALPLKIRNGNGSPMRVVLIGEA